MPTMQCGQRMIKVVSVRVGIGRPAHEQYRKARKIPDAMPSDPAENHKDRWEPHGYRTESCADIWAGVPTVGQIRQMTTRPRPVQRRVKKRKAPGLQLESWALPFTAHISTYVRVSAEGMAPACHVAALRAPHGRTLVSCSSAVRQMYPFTHALHGDVP